MKILIIGDVVGRAGRNIIQQELTNLKSKYQVDITIANCENASGGNGLTEKNAKEFFENGVDIITMGNHVWDKKDIVNYIDDYTNLIRPANYPDPCPGKGYTIFEKNGIKIGVINISGIVYLNNLICPFTTIDAILEEISSKCKIIILDFHGEATSEKIAMGYYSDGRVSLVYGTHTHVQTADKRILPQGTGYITDVGMTGPFDGVLGVDKDIIIQHLKSRRPVKFEIATGIMQINGLYVEINEKTGKCEAIDNFIKVIE
ncbi:TIGR00282 family metallophosphoesterase [Alkalibaculum sp. M08DMB]|uniref:TIGR00282 family metallophosphoesterase n=1 Tax=Alkalibaculum sporogenes TaxID=2655001 RepID=A0A6A7K8P0_9FIRM|nr:TIGR00282 family metallophosphoesterase [Alkalibaculum sporogenes]MPW25810.1 TIGR00282 family metallophosphoesterase [Alkalibaculum sporogenes]